MTLKPLIGWVKANKIASLIIAVLAIPLILSWWPTTSFDGGISGVPEFFGGIGGEKDTTGTVGIGEDRVVIEESTLSMVASDVSQTAEDVVSYAEKEGGFLVSSEILSPEESPVATVVVRVPSAKLRAVIEYFKTLAVKVASENITGVDVTEEYADLDKRIATLEETIDQFEAIKA
ncbi:MAG: DUF4349 domain-containing protein, partial [Patescibacteria group bacterium]